jgi:trans-2,3-dihydro-3-hydroxyanthranilate isomerase
VHFKVNMSRSFEFVQLDVFTRTPLAGNPLAVFADARGLSDQEMQALAREMNLSETTFILPRNAREQTEKGTRVRIFTVEEELPFAGHPTLGTALYLYSTARAGTDRISLDLNVGKIDIVFRADSQNRTGRVDGNVFGEMRQRDPEFGQTLAREKMAGVLRGGADQIAAELPAEVVSTGLPFAIVPIRDAKTLSILQPDLSRMDSVLEGTNAKFCYFIAPDETEGWRSVHARMFFYGGEDPATGSAAGCAAAWMIRHGVAKSDEQVVIHQGVQARRPSEIFVRATRDGETVNNVRVGGYAAEVLRGTLNL